MMKDTLEKYIQDYHKNYDDAIVDEAVRYIDKTVLFSDMYVGLKDSDDYEENLKRSLRCDTLRAYMTGVMMTMYMDKDKILKNSEIKRYKNFRKEKDFCVAFYFADNDFGSDIMDAAQTYAQSYNRVLGYIDNYTDDEFEQIREKSLYAKDIVELEKPNIVKSILKTGFCSAYMKGHCDNVMRIKELDPDDVFSYTKKMVDYLKFDDDSRWFFGTIDDVQDRILDRFKGCVENPETTNISNIWMNGECLFIAIIDGEMKVWLR